MITITNRLTGSALLEHVSQNRAQEGSKSELCKSAGYVKTLRDGSIGADFVGFYESLLAAKQEANPELFKPESDYPEYDSLSDETKDLYDELSEGIGRTWKHEEQLDFIQELEDIGIETAERFRDVFDRSVDNTWKAKADFAEECMVEIESSLQDSLAFHAIDWQSVWDHQLKYDFNTIEFDGSMYFFRNC